jgi:hypothetical protein
VALVGVVVVLCCAAAALAGQYHVYSCSDPVTQAPLPTYGWKASGNGPSENECASDPADHGLKAMAVAQFGGTHATWTFTAVADTRIVAATLYRSVVANYRARGYWSSPENEEVAPDAFDSCQGADSIHECLLGNTVAQVCEPAECQASYPGYSYVPVDLLSVPSDNLPSGQLSFSMRCLTGGCAGSEAMHSADITLQQDAAPTAAATGGSLTTQTVLQGVEAINITASDPGSGVFQAIFEIDGKPLSGKTLNPNGGNCEPYAKALDGTNVFLNPTPCPQAVSNIAASFNTAQIPDGEHQLSVLVSDAAGNTTTILSRTVVFNNSGEYIVQLQRRQQAEQQQHELSVYGACNAGCDSHARLLTTGRNLTAKAITRRYAHSALTLSGRLLDHTGAPMVGAEVELLQQPTYLGAKTALVATNVTNAEGDWKLYVSRGPSRLIIVGYRSRSKDAAYATQLQYREKVFASVRLAAPHHVRPGQAFSFRGALAGGYLPANGVFVSLEIYYGGRWREIALLSTNHRGAFTYRYTFASVEPITYHFRAVLPAMMTYPFIPAASPSANVRLKG